MNDSVRALYQILCHATQLTISKEMPSYCGNGKQYNIIYNNDLDSDSDHTDSSITEHEHDLPVIGGMSCNEQNAFTCVASTTQVTHSNERNVSSLIPTSTEDISRSEQQTRSSFGTASTEYEVSKERNPVSFQSSTSDSTMDKRNSIQTHSLKDATSNNGDTQSLDLVNGDSFVYDSETISRDLSIFDTNSLFSPPSMRVVVQVGRGGAGNITSSDMQFPYGNGLGLNSMPFLPSFLLRGGSMGSGDPYDPVEGLSRLSQEGSDPLSRLREINSNLAGLLGIRQNTNFDARDFLEMLSDQEPDASSHINLERLPTKKYVKRSGVEDERCDICSETYNAGDELRTLTCFHDYHTACIDMWLQKNNTCPVCRVEVHTEGD